jgi:hypothetical protein
MKRSRQITVLGILLISGAILLGGCGGGGGGGGDRLTKDEYAAKANALCAGFEGTSSALWSSTTSAEIIAGLDKLLPIEQKLVTDLKKLNPPADEEATAKKAIALGEEVTSGEEELNAALKKGDMTKAQKMIPPLSSKGNQANALFRQLGAKKCAE